MKILYIAPNFQHPTVRGPTRCYHFIKELHRRHEITLLTPVRSPVPIEALDEMKGYLKDIYLFNAVNGADESNGATRGLLGKLNKKVHNTRRLSEAADKLKAKFRKIVAGESFDVVVFHGKSIFPVIEDFEALPVVIDFCDATSMRYQDRMKFESLGRRLMLSRRYQYYRDIEERMIRKTPHVAFISIRDRDAVMEKPHEYIRIVPIGVDLDFWSRRSHQPQKNCLIFTGVMDYRPNTDAALYLIDQILPLVRPRVPDLEVLIVGRNPTPELTERGKKHPDVTVTGFVEDVRDFLERAELFVAPVRYGSGIQNKVLEAFAMQVPVVCSTTVARGLQCEDNEEIPVHVADAPDAFAGKIVELLAAKAGRERLAAAGRQFVEKHFIWARNAEILEQMCCDAVAVKNKP